MRQAMLSLALLTVVGLPMPDGALAQSLWVDQVSLLADHRARAVGDVVTVVVDERSTADRQGETTLKKDSTFGTGTTRPVIGGHAKLSELLPFFLNSQLNSDFTGKGTKTRSDRLTFEITVRVMKVLGNGNLLIEGRRSVAVGQETQHLVLTGIVRPQDVAPDNTVRSALVADAEVRLDGSGVITDKEKPGLVGRIFDFFGLY
ncbi:MAG: flagellar basal body L-ring protein FlgH [Candidatus Methylomirabilia bacterium]